MKNNFLLFFNVLKISDAVFVFKHIFSFLKDRIKVAKIVTPKKKN